MKLELNIIESVPCIEFEMLSKISERDFFLTKALSMDIQVSKKLIDYYNEVRSERYGYEGVLPAEYTYEYNKIAKDWQRKIITVGIDDDMVIFVLKRVQMFSAVYTRIEGLPISINNNHGNEHKVLLELTKYKLFNKISVASGEIETVEKWGYEFSEKIESYNFYSHIPSNFERVGANKWRTKKGVNRMLKMENLTWEILKEPDNKISIMNAGFDRYKKEIDKTDKGWHRLSKGIQKYPYWDDKNVIYYMVSYKEIPVGFCVYILNGKIAHQIVNKSIGRAIYDVDVKLSDKEMLEFDEIKKRMGSFIHYITVKDIKERGITDSYFGGALGTDSLRKYKQIMNDVEFSHYIYKWGDGTITTLNEEENKEMDAVKKRMGNYIHYVTTKDLNEKGIKDCYYGGSFDIGKGKLRIHKSELNDSEVTYYIYK